MMIRSRKNERVFPQPTLQGGRRRHLLFLALLIVPALIVLFTGRSPGELLRLIPFPWSRP
jgi:hypothetical protein